MLKKTGLILAFDEADTFTAGILSPLALDVVGIHPTGGSRAAQGITDTLDYIKSEAYQAFAAKLRASGKQLEFEAHAHPWLLPETLFAAHPDWFRMKDDGVRAPDYNLCVSNRDALEHLKERAAALASLLPPDTGRYLYWTADVRGDCFCHCPDCRDLSPSDQYMVWCNTVLEGVRRTDPAATLPYLAYHGTMPPPRNVEPSPGIFLEYAPILRDSYIPLGNKGCEDNRREAFYLPDLVACFGSKDAQVLEYWLDNSRFSHFRKPMRRFQFDGEILRRDLEFYLELGFEWITTFACWAGRDYTEEYGEYPFAAYVNILNSFR